jgi:hypothetical protein
LAGLAVAAALLLSSGVDAAVKSEAARGAKPKTQSYGLPQVEFINTQIHQGWQAAGFTSAGPATDGEYCRRLYLDVLGRLPTVDEIDGFVTDGAADKKLKLVNKLLGDDYVEEYARNWTTLWTNILIGRTGGTERRSPINREGMQQALRRAFQRNMPYDKMAYEIISAKGVSKPGEEKFNGFVNFMTGKMEENGVQATAKTAQIFLGLQVQCTQCHNHPFNEWKQNQFWEMNAFFRQTRALRKYAGGREVESVELNNQDFGGEDGNGSQAALFYELRNGKVSVAYPVFVDGQKLKSDSGFVDQIDRRAELAKMVVKSEYLGKEIVNRMWAHFLGYGFTKPIDDIGPHNVPSHPELMDGLAKEIRLRSFDLKELIRWIVLSEPYSLSSRFGSKNRKDDPALGEKPMFSHFYLRQMRAEELYESLLVATEAHKTGATYEEQEASKREWLSQFNIAFGTDENDETTTFNGTIPQALMMMNGDLVNKAISIDKGSFLARVAADSKLANSAKINYLYTAALARKPTKDEVYAANTLVQLRKGDTAAAMQDIWWALLNSNEFILNH